MSDSLFNPGGGLTTVALNLSTTPTVGSSHVSPDLAFLLAAACLVFNERPAASGNNVAVSRSTVRANQKQLQDVVLNPLRGLGSTGGSATAGVHEYFVAPSRPGTFTSGSLSGEYDGFVLYVRNSVTGATVGTYFIPFASLATTFNLAAINCASF